MTRALLRAVWLSFPLWAALGCSGADEDARALFRVAANATQPLDVGPLNERLRDLPLGSADERPGAVEAAAFLWRSDTPARQAIAATRRKDGKAYDVTVVRDGIPEDDSVSGYRFELTLSREDSGAWKIVSGRESWRCWPDRGHQDFNTKPCN